MGDFYFRDNSTHVNVSKTVEGNDVDDVVVKSSKFLKKLEQKAQDNIIAALKLNNNTFTSNVIIEQLPMTCNYGVKVIFSLNNEVIVVKYESDMNGIDMDELIATVAKEIAIHIVAKGLSDLKNSVDFSIFQRKG